MTAPSMTIARGDGSLVMDARRTVVRDTGAWTRLWTLHAGPEAPVPPVDFASQMIAAVFAGARPTPGFEVEVTGTRREGSALAVLVEERQPASGAMVPQMTVTPFHIVAMPRYDGEVRFSGSGSTPVPDVRRSPARARGGDAPSSTGLDPSFAAALAYLAGPFSGILVLLAERSSRVVRFHAWQAILGLGGLGLLALALLVSAFLALFVSPTGFTVLYWLAAVAGALWVVAWGVCVAAAFNGRVWKMPLVGGYATRRAAIGIEETRRRA